MRRSVLIKFLAGCCVICGILLGGFYWLQNNCNSNYIAAKCEQKIKSRCNPLALQSWATNLVANSARFTNALSSSIPVSEELKQIWKHRPSVFIREPRNDSEGYVYLAWGSGVLGHWGLSIGSPTFVPAQWDRQGVQWQPGI